MTTPVYALTLRKSYYDQGFFNFGVEVNRFVRRDSGPAVLLLGASKVRLDVKVNREANQNGTPRVFGGAELRNWLQRNFRGGDKVMVHILGPSEYWLIR